MRKGISLLFFFVSTMFVCNSYSQTVKQYSINVDVSEIIPHGEHLNLGGANPKGDTIAVNNYYVSLNNKAFIPIAGEFHFSRYPIAYWDESIKKMKAGGINIIATYVFWNIHEEKEGVFDWKGDKDLKYFIELCAKNNIYVIVRIGPFCHGEIRSGGLPDWLMGKPLTIRSNDPLYLFYVEKLYKNIGDQLKGLCFKDGGPIIGVQIENEYQHSAAPWGLIYPGQPYDWTASDRDLSVTQQGVGIAEGKNPYAHLGNDHMKILKSLAIKAGLDVPIYTATGWGNAAVIPNECIPVTGAYAYPFWTPKKDLSPFFMYKNLRAHPDYEPVRYKPEDYPAFNAELGTGIMSVYTRRPIAEHKSFDAMINRCLGSGCNGLGYYMYHGGSTPRGTKSFFSDEAYGLPKISYDFQAPIGEFGQVREGFQRLKLVHSFLNDFGDMLAPMKTVLPENTATLTPQNLTDLRYAARVKGNSGFLFINNFQDDTITGDKKNIQLKIKTAASEILIPESGGLSINSEENAIFPFNLSINGANLIYATAQLLTKSDATANPYYVFFKPEGVNAEFAFTKEAGITIQKNNTIVISQNAKRILVKCNSAVAAFTIKVNGKSTKVLIVDKAMALTSYVIEINGTKHILFSDAIVLGADNSFTLLSEGKNNYNVSVYPKLVTAPAIDKGTIVSKKSVNEDFTTYTISLEEVSIPVQFQKISNRKYVVTLPASLGSLNDLILQVDYIGDTGMGFIDGELVTDEFYKGIPWQIGLRKFYASVGGVKEMVFYFRPLVKGATYLPDLQPKDVPDFGKANEVLELKKISFIPQYKTIIQFVK